MASVHGLIPLDVIKDLTPEEFATLKEQILHSLPDLSGILTGGATIQWSMDSQTPR